MKTRIISGFFLLLIIGALLYFGGTLCLAALALASLIAVFEYCRALKEKGHRPFFPVLLGAALLWYGALAFGGIESFGQLSGLFVMGLFALLSVLMVFAYPKQQFTDAALCLAGFIYLPLFFSLLFYVREQPAGLFYSVLIYLAAWGSDVFAYLCGRFFGKRKLAPELSPKKTVAGAIGGVLGGAVLCLLFTHFTAALFDLPYGSSMIFAGLYGAAGAVAGQLGDLLASSVKRMTGVKDFGKLIPGHGGILDRFDSVLTAGPLMAALLWALTLI